MIDMTEIELSEKMDLVYKNRCLIVDFLKLGKDNLDRDSLLIMNDLYYENELLYLQLFRDLQPNKSKRGKNQ
jgi:hypothetical protein